MKLKITVLAILCMFLYPPLTLATTQSQYETIFYTAGTFEETLKQAIAANPKDVEKIIAAAIATNPAEIERIIEVAVNYEPGLSAQIVNAAVIASPEQAGEIVFAAVTAQPERATQIVAGALNANSDPESVKVVLVAAVSAAPQMEEQIIQQAQEQGVDQLLIAQASAAGEVPDTPSQADQGLDRVETVAPVEAPNGGSGGGTTASGS